MTELDKFDRQILATLQQDCRTPSEQIAQGIGLSATAVQRRIKRLREAGVIRAEVALLDAPSLGLGVSTLVEVELAEASSAAVIDGFKRRMTERPEVLQCFYVAGQADFVLLIVTPDMVAYERLSRELFFDDANVRKFRSTFVLENAKLGLNLPVPD